MPVDYPVVEWRDGPEHRVPMVAVQVSDRDPEVLFDPIDALLVYVRLGRVLAANVRPPEVINPEAVGDPDQTPIVRIPP